MPRRSAYFDRLLATVRRSTGAERQELLDFRARMYGPQSIFADPSWAAWLYDYAPGVQAKGPALWTWWRDGRIEGHQGAIRTRLRVGEAERDLAWAVDLMVSPECRSRGIGAVMPQKVLEEATIVAGTEVSEAAQKAFVRDGWIHLGTLTQWVRPIDASAMARSAAANGRSLGPAARVLGQPATLALSLLRHLGRWARPDYRLLPGEEFDERADRVWERCGSKWPVIARRDREWLRWRWGACPRPGTRLVWLERRGKTLGWAVLATREHHGLPAGFILDLLCCPTELRALLALAVNEFYRAGGAAVYCLLQAPGARAALTACGFIPRDSGFAMMVNVAKVSPVEQALLSDASNWFVTAGDSDLDRPRENTVYA